MPDTPTPRMGEEEFDRLCADLVMLIPPVTLVAKYRDEIRVRPQADTKIIAECRRAREAEERLLRCDEQRVRDLTKYITRADKLAEENERLREDFRDAHRAVTEWMERFDATERCAACGHNDHSDDECGTPLTRHSFCGCHGPAFVAPAPEIQSLRAQLADAQRERDEAKKLNGGYVSKELFEVVVDERDAAASRLRTARELLREARQHIACYSIDVDADLNARIDAFLAEEEK